jgi:hypothetical protein
MRCCEYRACCLYYKSMIIIYDRNESTIIIYDRNDSTIIIYDHNDSGLYYKTTIVARYELKLCSKLKHILRSYNHNLHSLVMLRTEA